MVSRVYSELTLSALHLNQEMTSYLTLTPVERTSYLTLIPAERTVIRGYQTLARGTRSGSC